MQRILVIDDDPAVLNLLTHVLGEQYTVAVARNGAEALDSMRSSVPHAIVLDLMMPVMDGWTFLRVCRGQQRFDGVPVIILSAEPTAGHDSHRLGAQACVSKPFDVDSLLATVEHLITPRCGRDAHGGHPNPVGE